jgi:hypothetical protein
MTDMNPHEVSPFVCDMTAIDPASRTRHAAITVELFQAVDAIRELPNGYAFRLHDEAALLMKVAEFIANERLCCPFFGFTVEVEPQGGAFWLHLTGREGVKPFIQAEVGAALNESVARAANFG